MDTLELDLAGYDAMKAIPLAMKKDSGLTPAQLAWVLSTLHVGDDAKVPGGHTPAELRSFSNALQERLVRLSHPE